MREKTDNLNKEKRHYGRVHFLTGLILTFGGKSHRYDETWDISMEGVFVISDLRPPVGTEGKFSFNLAFGDSPEVNINGKFKVVNWQERESNPGFGINFTDVDSDSSLELYKVIRYNTPD